MIFQDPFACLHPMYTVGDQIVEAVRAHRHVSRSAGAGARSSCSGGRHPEPASGADDYPHQFSGGMRQRAMIAMALGNTPTC